MHGTAIAVDSTLKLIHEAKVDFDADLSKYGIEKGVLTNPTEGEIFSPVAMLVEAVDIVLERLKEQGLAFDKVVGISGAGMQHGTVFWSLDAEAVLGSLNSGKTLLEQLVVSSEAFRYQTTKITVPHRAELKANEPVLSLTHSARIGKTIAPSHSVNNLRVKLEVLKSLQR